MSFKKKYDEKLLFRSALSEKFNRASISDSAHPMPRSNIRNDRKSTIEGMLGCQRGILWRVAQINFVRQKKD